MFPKLTTLTVLTAGFSPLATQAASYAISSVGKTEIVGISSAVPAGGDTTNFSSGTVAAGTTNAGFQLVVSGTSTRFADMKVTLAAVEGTLDTSGSRSGLMIAQTSNSQGLMDSGTLSVLTDFTAAGTSGDSFITLRFDFFEPDTVIPMAVALQLTSFDFDFGQFMGVENSDFITEAHGSNLTKASFGPTSTRWKDTLSSNSTFNQATNAVVLNNAVDSSFEITMGKAGTGNSLFMFEFRDPSEILDAPLPPIAGIPEPSAALLLLAGLGFVGIRRRTR